MNVRTLMRNVFLLMLISTSSCADDADDHGESCDTAARVAPLIGGSASANLLGVSAEHRAAIGRVWPEGARRGYFCTGVRVAPGWVLTAGHCEHGDGFVFERVDDEGQLDAGLEVPSRDVVAHPEHDALLFEIDQATEGVHIPLAAAPIDTAFVERAVQLAGYGQTENGGPSDELLFLAPQVMALTDGELVVDGLGFSGACLGDSGGPMLHRDLEGRLEVLGILTHGSRSCIAEDFYLRADRLLAWATEVTGAVDPIPEACDGLPEGGLCRDGVAYGCEDGRIAAERCQEGGCAFDAAAGRYACLGQRQADAADPCQGVADVGECRGQTFAGCDAGVLVEHACVCPTRCSWDPTRARFGCR